MNSAWQNGFGLIKNKQFKDEKRKQNKDLPG